VIGGARYWRIDPSADYGPLNRIACHRVNTNLIRENWDDLLRLAGSLKLGLVQATSIMRTLRIDDRPTRLAQAVAELGRIDKTVHGLTYVDDESKRRRTLTQLKSRRGPPQTRASSLPRQTRPNYVSATGKGKRTSWGRWAGSQHHRALEHHLHRCSSATASNGRIARKSGRSCASVAPGIRPYQPAGQVFLLAARFCSAWATPAAQKSIRGDRGGRRLKP
jgi:hypothetical protein